jgi:hypothetical protein
VFDLTRDRRDGGSAADVNRAYNEHWMDARRLKITSDHRTSLIVDPADGRIPPLVPLSPERQQVSAARAEANARFAAGLPKDHLDMSLPVRCIIRTDSPPYLPTIYNNDFHIFQSPGYVAIAPEMIHSARIIPLDGRPHLRNNLNQWLGDTRGRFDGNTLVVETSNFRSDDGVVFQGGNPAIYKITERFTRVDADTLTYEFTIEDPATWTRPWTARIPWTKIDPGEQMHEHACHEDNFDIVHFLTGARVREAAKLLFHGRRAPPGRRGDAMRTKTTRRSRGGPAGGVGGAGARPSRLQRRVRRHQTRQVQGHGHQDALGESARVDLRGREETGRKRRRVDDRDRHAQHAAPSRSHQGRVESGNANHRGRVSIQGRVAQSEWPRSHAAQRSDAVPRVVGHWFAR